ncbi:GntR family transcriptional regulator [Saccharopolyspora hattusasensis]|uniref:GntR family transcriptional regulator n=1 Tax=Saccharopolyspora hattusasensis TaxID=1128679 RepID=UPI003D99CA4C
MTTPPVSRYQQVAEQLREAITRGDYVPGQRLPGTAVLAEQYGLSYPTINKAIRLLATQGLVTVEHGRGTTVRERRTVTQLTQRYVTRQGDGKRGHWTTATKQQGFTASQEIRAVETISPPTEIAGYLELDDDSAVIVRRRLLRVDGAPDQLADSYYPVIIAEGTELADPSTKMRGTTVTALERLGYVLLRFTEHLEARMPTAEEYRLLEMSPGTPVLRHIRVTYAEGNQPVEVTETIMTGDRHVMTYELPAHL